MKSVDIFKMLLEILVTFDIFWYGFFNFLHCRSENQDWRLSRNLILIVANVMWPLVSIATFAVLRWNEYVMHHYTYFGKWAHTLWIISVALVPLSVIVSYMVAWFLIEFDKTRLENRDSSKTLLFFLKDTYSKVSWYKWVGLIKTVLLIFAVLFCIEVAAIYL